MTLFNTNTQYQKKILIVEDEKLIGWSIAKFLQKTGFQVFDTNSTKQAIEILKSGKFNLVLTDQNLPLPDIRSFVDNIKQKDPEIRVILMSSTPPTKEEKDEFKNKVDGFIEKPVDFDELIRLIDHLLK